MAGQAAAYDELRARRCLWSPLRLTRLCREHVSVFVASPATSLFVSIECGGRSKMRFIGIDVHRDFCEMCVLAGDSGEEQRRRVATRPAELEAFARELDRSDVVALETSSPATAVARVLEPYAGRVMVIDPRGLVRAGARAKTDRLVAAGVLTEIWTPDEATRALPRLVARRAAVVRARTRLKNEVHAVLARSLCPRPPVSDAFGKSGRRCLEALELPEEEQLTVRGCLRQIDALDADVAELEAARRN